MNRPIMWQAIDIITSVEDALSNVSKMMNIIYATIQCDNSPQWHALLATFTNSLNHCRLAYPGAYVSFLCHRLPLARTTYSCHVGCYLAHCLPIFVPG